MSITGRLFGFALLGPIGAVGPTEASKRAKAQKKLLEEQNGHLARMADAAERASDERTPGEPYADAATKFLGDRVEALREEHGLALGRGPQGPDVTVPVGAQGTVIKFAVNAKALVE